MTDSQSQNPELIGERPSAAALQLFLDGEGPQFLRDEVARWVESCPETRAEFEQLQAISLGLRDLPELTAPTAVRERLLARIQDRTRAIEPLVTVPIAVEPPSQPSRWSGLLAASILIGMLTALWFTSDEWRQWLPQQESNQNSDQLARTDGDGSWSGRAHSSEKKALGSLAEDAPTGAVTLEEIGADRTGAGERISPISVGAPTPGRSKAPRIVQGEPSTGATDGKSISYYALIVEADNVSIRPALEARLAEFATSPTSTSAAQLLTEYGLRPDRAKADDAAYLELRLDVSEAARTALDQLASSARNTTSTAHPSAVAAKSAPDASTAQKKTRSRGVPGSDDPNSSERNAGTPDRDNEEQKTDKLTAQAGKATSEADAPQFRIHVRLVAPTR